MITEYTILRDTTVWELQTDVNNMLNGSAGWQPYGPVTAVPTDGSTPEPKNGYLYLQVMVRYGTPPTVAPGGAQSEIADQKQPAG